jgi:hypothetical protein
MGMSLSEGELEEFHWHLRNHAFIHDADYEVPNTLKTQGS